MTKTEVITSLKTQRIQALERFYNGTKLRDQAEKDLVVIDTAIEAASVKDEAPAVAEVPVKAD